jgi:hypothetical protein
VRCQIVIPVLFQGIQTVPVEDLVDVGADLRLVLVCRESLLLRKLKVDRPV